MGMGLTFGKGHKCDWCSSLRKQAKAWRKDKQITFRQHLAINLATRWRKNKIHDFYMELAETEYGDNTDSTMDAWEPEDVLEFLRAFLDLLLEYLPQIIAIFTPVTSLLPFVFVASSSPILEMIHKVGHLAA